MKAKRPKSWLNLNSKNKYFGFITSLLLILAWPPIPYSAPLLLIALLPVLLHTESIIQSDNKRKGKRIFWTTFLVFFIWNTASIYWVFNAMNAFLSVPVSLLISLIPFGLAPLLMATCFWIYGKLRKRLPLLLSLLALASLWTCYEYLHQWWDLAFPWMTLGNGWANFHELAQWYSFTGVFGGTWWIWGSNILIFLLCVEPKKAKTYAAALAAWLTVPMATSLYIYSSYEEPFNPSQIVVVQPNVDPYGKFSFISHQEQLENLMRLSESVAPVNTEFFIWPETALSDPNGINEDEFREYPQFSEIQGFLMKFPNGNVLSGIESFQVYSEPRTITARDYGGVYIDHFNAGVLIDNSSKLQYYHKSKLVPGVEQLPFGEKLAFMKPLFQHFGGTTGGYGKQSEPSVLYSASGIGAAPVICYESIWGNYVSDYINKGAQFIAIITNDGWWGNTSGKDQHLQYAKLRAIETRRWVARSANTGISAFINQKGDIVEKTSWWEEAALTQEINLNEEITFYSKHKDWVFFASGVILILTIIGFLKNSKRKQQ
ncbi:MAG TPA: apolipoprotein N-acyltransferase [Candidatus Sphingobacterium stercoripullorum]|nr:apolipoprotein N-acyltransferase [Candidatus Sphingobacterium stercoripullorum]